MAQKDSEIEKIISKNKALEIKIRFLEKGLGEIDEKLIEASRINQVSLNESISALEFRLPSKEILNCESCAFTTESEKGLKVHMKRKHDNSTENEFPKACDFCYTTCSDKCDMEIHLKEHTYKTLELKCEDCDFLSADKLSLEIHAERTHTGDYYCTICGFKANNLSELDIHLHTCETFTCDFCHPKIKVKHISDLKSHLTSKHSKHLKNTDIIHTKMDRKDFEKVSQNTLSSAYFLRNNTI